MRSPRLRSDVPLKMLADFRPTAEWLLEPGDMLYLPPRWGHEGVAEGETLTFLNSPWRIPRFKIAETLGLDRLTLLNDFGAVAHAVSVMGPEAFEPIAGPPAEKSWYTPIPHIGIASAFCHPKSSP